MTRRNNILSANFWINFFDSILEVFRKKEYYVVDYNELNTYSIEFKILDDLILSKIKDVIKNFQEARVLEDLSASLQLDEYIVYESIDSLLENIKRIISKDYSKTYFESIKNNWEFNYFLSYPSHSFSDVLFIYNRIRKNNEDEESSVFYSLLAIKKIKGKLYLWNLLDEYENVDE